MNSPAFYEAKYNIRLTDRLGHGKDGFVFKSDQGNAIKFFNDEALYRRELRAYQILRHGAIAVINGFFIPELLHHDDPLRAIEMSIVQPPFLLDFAAAYTIDEFNRFEFTEDVLAETEAKLLEMFDDRWPIVNDLCNAFTRETGLILLDLSLNNVKFAA